MANSAVLGSDDKSAADYTVDAGRSTQVIMLRINAQLGYGGKFGDKKWASAFQWIVHLNGLRGRFVKKSTIYGILFQAALNGRIMKKLLITLSHR